MRLPTRRHNTLWNEVQKLHLLLSNERSTLIVGDAHHRLSPLTELCYYGRGIGFHYYRPTVRFGGFFAKDRYRTNYYKREKAAYVQWTPCWPVTLGAQVLEKKILDECSRQIVSVNTHLRLLPSSLLELEYALSGDSMRGFESRGHSGYRLAYYANGPNGCWMKGERMYTGPNFQGQSNGLNLSSLAAQWKSNRWCTSVGWKRWRQDRIDCCRLNRWRRAIRQNTLFGQSLYSFSRCFQLGCRYDSRLFKDLQRLPEFDTRQQWLGPVLILRSNSTFLIGHVSLGQYEDYVHHKTDTASKFGAQYTYFASSAQQLCLMGEMGQYYPFEPSQWCYNLRSSWRWRYQPKCYWEVSGQYACHRRRLAWSWSLRSRLCHTFANDHSISAQTRYFSCRRAQQPYELEFLCHYSIPFQVAVGRKYDHGSICGVVRDTDTKSPIANALVSLEKQKCLTDHQGRFVFNQLAPNKYTVSVEALPDEDQIACQPEQTASVCGGRLSCVSFDCVATGTLTVLLKEMVLQPSLECHEAFFNGKSYCHQFKHKGPMEGVRIVLCTATCGDPYQAGISDSRGQVQFTEIPRGRWLLQVDQATLPDGYEVSFYAKQITIETNVKGQVCLECRPKVQTSTEWLK